MGWPNLCSGPVSTVSVSVLGTGVSQASTDRKPRGRSREVWLEAGFFTDEPSHSLGTTAAVGKLAGPCDKLPNIRV